MVESHRFFFFFSFVRARDDCCCASQEGPQYLWRNDLYKSQITVVHVIYPKPKLSRGRTSQRSLVGLVTLLSIPGRCQAIVWLQHSLGQQCLFFTSIQTLIRWGNAALIIVWGCQRPWLAFVMYCVTYLNCSASSDTLHNVNLICQQASVAIWTRRGRINFWDMCHSIVWGYT